MNGIMYVGVANLATRAATPLAGGFEPPLPGAVGVGAGGSPNWRPLLAYSMIEVFTHL